MKDFVTSQPAAGALFTIVLSELCDFSVATSGKRLKGRLRAAGTAVSPGPPCARLAGSLRRRWPSTRTAKRGRGGDHGGEAGTWLLLGDEGSLVLS